ncbi:MAG: cupin domain-containing protein [Bacteroidota bacterium]
MIHSSIRLRLSLLLFLAFYLNISFAQDPPILQPLLLDKSVLSGLGLKKIEFKEEPEKQFYQKRLYRGADISVYVVSTGTWTNTINNYSFDEYIYLFHGEAITEPQNGASQIFRSGDTFFAPKGYNGKWIVNAGQHLHYELSVITTKRADSTQVVEGLMHQLFDPAILSGTSIEFGADGLYSKTLVRGAELTIRMKAEQPREKSITDPMKEQLIQLLSGQLQISDEAQGAQTFYAGDFFVLPKGFKGKWKSEGHGLIKYLTVEKTDWN